MSANPQDMSIRELRELTQGRTEPPVYVPARWVSIYLSRIFARTPLTPNEITLMWGLLLVASGALFAVGTRRSNLIAIGLIFAAYILDCVDGEVARIRGISSNIGSSLEQIVHWSTNLTVLAGASIGSFKHSHNPNSLVIGLAAVAGDATFHFMYVSLRVAASPGAQYGWLARMTRWQYQLMPITTNVLVVGALVGNVEGALLIWSVWSNAAWMLGFTLFFLTERKLEPIMKVIQEALDLAQRQSEMESQRDEACVESDRPTNNVSPVTAASAEVQ